VGFPFQVESLKDVADNAVHALNVHKAHDAWDGPPPPIKGSLNRPCRVKTLPDYYG